MNNPLHPHIIEIVEHVCSISCNESSIPLYILLNEVHGIRSEGDKIYIYMTLTRGGGFYGGHLSRDGYKQT